MIFGYFCDFLVFLLFTRPYVSTRACGMTYRGVCVPMVHIGGLHDNTKAIFESSTKINKNQNSSPLCAIVWCACYVWTRGIADPCIGVIVRPRGERRAKEQACAGQQTLSFFITITLCQVHSFQWESVWAAT